MILAQQAAFICAFALAAGRNLTNSRKDQDEFGRASLPVQRAESLARKEQKMIGCAFFLAADQTKPNSF
jgi:hypothetical protein